MVVKLNNKVITVNDEPMEDKESSLPYFMVSCCGYSLILWIMDYVCFTFFSIHPFPFLSGVIHNISGWIHLIGGLF
jgi:hypothetical protein